MSLPLQEHIGKDGFRLRGVEFSRIDAFSDVVFGFALTLLVVSLEVPKTYAELHESLHGFFPFAISFAMLMMIWFGHYKYFRRFGTHDLGTICINGGLLFVVLFYVYPLKFLFTFVLAWAFGLTNHYLETDAQLRELMVLYGLGFASVYLLIGALYWNGWRQRAHLRLSALEEALTRSYIAGTVGIAAIGLFSCGVAWALPIRVAGLAGWTFLLIWPFKTLYGKRTRRRVAKLAASAKHKLNA